MQMAKWIKLSQVVAATFAGLTIILALISHFAQRPELNEYAEWCLYGGFAGLLNLMVLRRRQRALEQEPDEN